MKKYSLLISLSIALTMLIIIASCSKSKDKTPTPVTTATQVAITNFAFNSADLHVATGTTVTWTNNDTAPHTVTADDASFTSITLNKGETYSKKFTTAGTYHYHCSIHTMMTAEVVVQ